MLLLVLQLLCRGEVGWAELPVPSRKAGAPFGSVQPAACRECGSDSSGWLWPRMKLPGDQSERMKRARAAGGLPAAALPLQGLYSFTFPCPAWGARCLLPIKSCQDSPEFLLTSLTADSSCGVVLGRILTPSLPRVCRLKPQVSFCAYPDTLLCYEGMLYMGTDRRELVRQESTPELLP